MSWRILITCPHLQRTLDEYMDTFADHDIEVVAPQLEQKLSEAELLEIIDRFDGVIAGDDPFSEAVLEKGRPRLKTIAKWGIGIDAIDLDAAERLGITVTNTPGAFGDEVADVTMGYVIMLARHLGEIDRGVRMGEWPKPEGMTLRGKIIGVVGLGSTGQAVIRRAVAFGLHPIGHEVRPEIVPRDLTASTGLELVDLDTLLSRADIVTLHCNLTEENRHLIDADAIGRMKPSAVLVNVARGPLVDEAALLDSLRAGQLAGAALDVFECEPPSKDSTLTLLNSVVLGSHNASNTSDAVRRVNNKAIENLLDGLDPRRG